MKTLIIVGILFLLIAYIINAVKNARVIPEEFDTYIVNNNKFLETMKTTTIKEVFSNKNWIITKAEKGCCDTVYISAERKPFIQDEENTFHQLCGRRYVDYLSIEYYNKKINELDVYENN